MALREQIIRDAFARLDRHVRPATAAQVGGFRPPTDPVASWFGGRFVGLPEDGWPRQGDEPMLPLIQVRVDELPYGPPALGGIALLAVFIGPRELPIDLPAANGNRWVIRTYPTTDGLVPLAKPAGSAAALKPFPIRWGPPTREGPHREAAWVLAEAEMAAFDQLGDADDLFNARYPACFGTKVGGWPTYAQSPIDDDRDYVLQIGSEEKPGWMWGDNGYGHLRRTADGDWTLYWDCY
jgi:hypothetical protein